MKAEEIIELVESLPEHERAKVAQFMIEENLKATQRRALLASLTTALVLLSVFGIVWLCLRTPERPRVATKSSPAAVEPVAPEPPQATPIPPVASIPNPPLNIQPRDTSTGSNLIDLTDFYNGDLLSNWQTPGERGNDLRELPRGVQKLADTQFDVRGVIAVNQEFDQPRPGQVNLPAMVEGIRVGRKCEQLHFLHSAYNAAFSFSQEIGHYRVHLANGQQHVIPIMTGRDVLDWHKVPPPGSRLVIAWEGDNPRTRQRPDPARKIRLYKTTWENPSPDVEVQTIDFVSRRGAPSPFLVAITAE